MCAVCQLPALSSLQYGQAAAVSNLDPDKTQIRGGWSQLPAERCRDDVTRNTTTMSVPQPQDTAGRRPPALISTASGTSVPPPRDVKYLGPLSSEMKYPDMYAAPHGGATRTSFRRTQLGNTCAGLRTVDLYTVPASLASTAGSLRRKSNDTGGRPRDAPTTFGTRHVGLPPGECSRKHDWTAECELEYRV